MQLQALATFKFHALPAQVVDQFSDTLEKCLDLSQNNTSCIMEDTIEVLATFLTTQSSITGPSLADRSKSMGANQACAALTYKNPRSDGQNQNQPDPGEKSSDNPDQSQDADLAALQQKSKSNKQRSGEGGDIGIVSGCRSADPSSSRALEDRSNFTGYS